MSMVPHVDRPHRGSRLSGAAAHRIVLLGALCSLVVPHDAIAQHLRGRLLELETDRPIAAGFLTLLTTGRSPITAAMTDADGNWRLEVPRPGVYYIAAERIGYERWIAGPVELAAKDDWNSVFHLRPVPIQLEPIEVQVAAVRRYLEYNGFFERQRSNFGHFVTPAAIQQRQAARVTDLLTGIPGVQRVALPGGRVGPGQILLRGSSLSQGSYCRPRVFVDGLMYSRGDARPVRLRDPDATEQTQDDLVQRMDRALSLDDIGHPSTIAAIEVYRSASQIPVQFGGSSVETLCGVIVVWTRSGRMRFGER
jgi:TonB-dependent Receptor Plug Domain